MTRAIILFGHGSRDPQWREPMDAVATHLAALEAAIPVTCAFLELQPPDLATAVSGLVERGATRLCVLPMFLGIGKHAREDLPKLVAAARAAHPGVTIDLRRAVGEDPRIVDLVARIALELPGD